jgi:alcohol dehydrogenase (cytochrome c)
MTASCFLSDTANTVQALNAKTGELIWENRIGPRRPAPMAPPAAGALWRQGVCAHHRCQALCLEAKTGKIVWQSGDRECAGGLQQHGGAMTIRGKVLVGLTYCNRYETKHCFISAMTPTPARWLGASRPSR